jgi:hypothetical protein
MQRACVELKHSIPIWLAANMPLPGHTVYNILADEAGEATPALFIFNQGVRLQYQK